MELKEFIRTGTRLSRIGDSHALESIPAGYRKRRSQVGGFLHFLKSMGTVFLQYGEQEQHAGGRPYSACQ